MTSGGPLFTLNSGYLVALDAMDLKTVWKTNMGGLATNAPGIYPVTYEVNGRQFEHCCNVASRKVRTASRNTPISLPRLMARKPFPIQ
jgi:hypothetical protein